MVRAVVLLAQGFEEIEAVTAVDVFRRAEVETFTAALHGREVRGSRGLVVVADADLEALQADAFDLVYLPGGSEGAKRLAADPRVGDLLRATLAAGGRVAAICAAPFALAAHGVLRPGARVTSHPSVAEHLSRYRYTEEPVVVDGPVATSRGPGTALLFALTLVELLRGADVRRALADAMQVQKRESPAATS